MRDADERLGQLRAAGGLLAVEAGAVPGRLGGGVQRDLELGRRGGGLGVGRPRHGRARGRRRRGRASSARGRCRSSRAVAWAMADHWPLIASRRSMVTIRPAPGLAGEGLAHADEPARARGHGEVALRGAGVARLAGPGLGAAGLRLGRRDQGEDEQGREQAKTHMGRSACLRGELTGSRLVPLRPHQRSIRPNDHGSPVRLGSSHPAVRRAEIVAELGLRQTLDGALEHLTADRQTDLRQFARRLDDRRDQSVPLGCFSAGGGAGARLVAAFSCAPLRGFEADRTGLGRAGAPFGDRRRLGGGLRGAGLRAFASPPPSWPRASRPPSPWRGPRRRLLMRFGRVEGRDESTLSPGLAFAFLLPFSAMRGSLDLQGTAGERR